MIQRQTFGKPNPVIPPPNLIEIQTKSYEDFLQADIPPAKRDNAIGLQAVFREVFPIEDSSGKYVIDFVKYELGKPKMSVVEALSDGGTYSAPLRATFALRNEKGESTEEDVFLGDIPLMTRDGAFVYNGAERVVVSQLHRSPGVCTEYAIHANGQTLYSVPRSSSTRPTSCGSTSTAGAAAGNSMRRPSSAPSDTARTSKS